MEHKYKDATIIIDDTDSTLFRIVIVVNGAKVKGDWLQQAWQYNDSASLARYFYKKHIEDKDDPTWLKRAEKKPVKHEGHTKQGFIDWLNEHQWEIVGCFGNYDTPVHRYIKETRETWKKSSFLIDGVYHNRPRWMTRLMNFCEAEYPGEVMGCQVIARMQSEQWDTLRYDTCRLMAS